MVLFGAGRQMTDIMTKQKILIEDLVVITDATAPDALKIDLVYAQADHPENIFKQAIYRSDAPCVLHKCLASTVILAAQDMKIRHGWTLVIKDALRPVEAQEAVFATSVVRANPHWTADGPSRMFANPGQGGHPRGMAVDVIALDCQGQLVDFGTVFDAMPDDPAINPAHRNYDNFGSPMRSVEVLANRQKLTQSMLDAAADCGQMLWPLRHEWWDYRLPPVFFNRYIPLSDQDLPSHLQMMPN
jgi:zinc D-Ala-D-Ala dipeptidase